MAISRRQRALKVDIPTTGNTPLRFGRVGLIAIVGFGIGLAWPRLAGMRLVPELPVAPAASQDLTGAPEDAPTAKTMLPPSAAAPTPLAPEPPPPAREPPVVGDAQVTSCRDAGGGRIASCDAVNFDRVARAELSSLDACPDARRVSGVVSLGFELDFTTERVTRIVSGKTTTLEDAALKTVLDCYRASFAKVTLGGIPHEHQRYTVFYRVELKGAEHEAEPAGSASAAPPVTPASGSATVSWDTALVHDTPERDSKVVARLRSGTRVGVTGRSGDWYRIRYDVKGREGWVFRTAVGL